MFYAVDGTPTDCVNLGVAILLKGELPDLVVSGINTGWNLGDDVTYSGTVAGALEGALLGIPAIAVSLRRTRDYVFDFGPSASGRRAHWPSWSCAIRCPIARFSTSTCRRGRRRDSSARCRGSAITSRRSPSASTRAGKPYYWIEEGIDEWTPHDRSDYHAVKEGYISVSLLHPDLTAHSALHHLEQFPLPTVVDSR